MVLTSFYRLSHNAKCKTRNEESMYNSEKPENFEKRKDNSIESKYSARWNSDSEDEKSRDYKSGYRKNGRGNNTGDRNGYKNNDRRNGRGFTRSNDRREEIRNPEFNSRFKLGRKQELVVVKTVDFGVYLGDSMETAMEDRVLLPKKQIPEGVNVGDTIEVFLYKDSKDRIIATTNTPVISAGEVGVLKVSQVTPVGAFLNWGLEKDILLPYKEQTKPVKEGEDVLVAIYVDKSKRLAATMKVYEYLDKNSDYQKDDRVTARIYQISEQFGAFAAVDDRFSALIPKRELVGKVNVGDVVEGRITAVREDGKIDLSIREKAYIQIEKDAQKLIELFDKNGGELPFTDKAAPEIIKSATGMSKNEFKRAIGHMLKTRKVEILEKTIKYKG